jgi:F-type H+-transporting ATPase subunit delta
MARLPARYARALYRAAGDAEPAMTERYAKLLDSLAREVSGNTAVARLMLSPHLASQIKKAAFSGTFGEAGDRAFLHFMETLADKGRLALIPAIAKEYGQLERLAKNEVEITVESAFPLDDSTLNRIRETFRKKTGASLITARVSIVPRLIGGIRVSAGGAIWDGSVRGTLDRLASVFNEGNKTCQ